MESNRMLGVISMPRLQMNNESMEFKQRLETFTDWSYQIVNKYALARAGFQFIGPGDKVQCAFCKGKLYNWETGDDPIIEHRKHFPYCAFILQMAEDNRKAVSPEYNKLAERRTSFPRGPIQFRNPNNLAAAGFYYDDEQTRCFYCGVGLRDWGPDDDPFHVHLMFNPCCGYFRNSSNVQRLGISEHAESLVDPRSLQQIAEASLIKDPYLQAKLDDVNTSLPLVKELLDDYDPEKILREMKLEIIKTGENYETVADFIAGVNKRDEAVRNRAAAIQESGSGPQLSAENERLRNLKLCKMCNTQESVLFLPCRHLVCCISCAGINQKCPCCNEKICGSVQVFYS